MENGQHEVGAQYIAGILLLQPFGGSCRTLSQIPSHHFLHAAPLTPLYPVSCTAPTWKTLGHTSDLHTDILSPGSREYASRHNAMCVQAQPSSTSLLGWPAIHFLLLPPHPPKWPTAGHKLTSTWKSESQPFWYQNNLQGKDCSDLWSLGTGLLTLLSLPPTQLQRSSLITSTLT